MEKYMKISLGFFVCLLTLADRHSKIYLWAHRSCTSNGNYLFLPQKNLSHLLWHPLVLSSVI